MIKMSNLTYRDKHAFEILIKTFWGLSDPKKKLTEWDIRIMKRGPKWKRIEVVVDTLGFPMRGMTSNVTSCAYLIIIVNLT